MTLAGTEPAPRRILFVDDEPNVLSGLERMLRPLRQEWTMTFVTSGEAALVRLEQEPFDVLVSDMRMPGMDGAALLEAVAERYPDAVRIILSGHADQQSVLRAVNCAHRYVSKPCDPQVLKATIRNALELRAVLHNPRLQRVIRQLKTLPSPPHTFLAINRELHSAEPSVRRVGELIADDPAMAAKLLQIVNSAFFGFRGEVIDPVWATQLLGIDTVRALVLCAHVFSSCEQRLAARFHLPDLWSHSTMTGLFASVIARAENAPSALVSQAHVAGILHDIGLLALMTMLPADRQALDVLQDEEAHALNAEVESGMGCTHADVGGYLLGLWGLPHDVVEAVVWHHTPGRDSHLQFSTVTAVHAADALARRYHDPDATCLLDLAYLERLGLTGRVDRWFEECRTAAAGGPVPV